MTRAAACRTIDGINMGGQLKNIAKISAATIGSRVLGFARDAATMAYLGLSAVNAAYTFAFTLPNLFRRLLGEGALSSAMIPIFAQSVEKSGKEAAFGFLNKVLTRTAILLAALTILGMALAFAASEADIQTQRFHLGASYLVVLLLTVVYDREYINHDYRVCVASRG